MKDPGSEAASSLASLSPSYRTDEARDGGRPNRVDMTSWLRTCGRAVEVGFGERIWGSCEKAVGGKG